MLFGKRSFLFQEVNDGAGSGGQTEKDKGEGTGGSGSGGEGEGAGGEKDKTSGKFDLSTLPKEAQDLIKSLRTENADHRTKNNNLSSRMEKIEKGLKGLTTDGEDDQEEPEVKLEKISNQAMVLEMRNSMLGVALENGITKDGYDYFEFLMAKELEALEEGQELSEEKIQEVIAKSKGTVAKANTSVTSKGKAPSTEKNGEITVEQFAAMGIMAKSKLYSEKPEVYNSLLNQAKTKKLLK